MPRRALIDLNKVALNLIYKLDKFECHKNFLYNVALLKQAWPNLLWPYLSQPNQPGPSSLDPLKAKKKVCVGGGENQKYCIAKVKVF